MKKLALLLSLIFSFQIGKSQSFSAPESVEFDSLNQRWIVGQNGSGKINILQPSSNTLLAFATGIPSGPHGIEILGNTVYACDGTTIKGFDLSSGTQTFNLSITGSTFLNGLTTDGTNYLFATDFSGKKIFRIHPASNQFNLMKTITKTPNGIYYDGPNNRCVFVTWGTNAEIQSMSLSDSSITSLKVTTLGSFDGITKDQQGNWYFTAWSNNALNRIDPAFSTTPVAVKTGLSSPADIDINSAGDSIGIPNSGNANNVVFYVIPNTSSISNYDNSESAKIFPVPSTNQPVNILLEKAIVNGKLILWNSEGKSVIQQKANGYAFQFHPENLPEGNYIIQVIDDSGNLILNKTILIGNQ